MTKQPIAQPTDAELEALWDEVAEYYELYKEAQAFARAVLARWGDAQ